VTAFNLSPGNPGIDGTGLSLLSWRNLRVCQTGDTAGVTVRYMTKWGGAATSIASTVSAASNSWIRAPRAGTLRDVLAKFLVAPPVTTTFTVLVNGVATSLAVNVSTNANSLDQTHTASIVQNDYVQVQSSFASGTAASTTTNPQIIMTLV
jgi:hypothetical protein